MQSIDYLKGVPRAAVYTSGFDPLRDVGVEYASKLQEAKNDPVWRHYDDMTHGWLQMTAWSEEAVKAVKDVASDLKGFCYKS
jgi:acetyl esterase/lipase